MRLIKLNKTHKAYKEHHHQWAFRFDSYDSKQCPKIERIMHDTLGSQYSYSGHSPVWKSNFGSPVRGYNGYRPYWISFINEADATLVLLQLNN
jgi:hypothetical protein